MENYNKESDIMGKLNLEEKPKLQVGDTILIVWDGSNLGGRKWCEREEVNVTDIPENDLIKCTNDVLFNPFSVDKLQLIGVNSDGRNYWLVLYHDNAK
jgi:hypothetical protein|tara:strand:+ start:192 stop:485 length:294 start_codon:yes stop_codon:yes gene_type:complete